MRFSLAVAIIALLLTAGTSMQGPRLPEGFREWDPDFWSGPWVFDETARALPALHNSIGQTTNGPLAIRLDDGSRGRLTVESKPCTEADDCAPFDCGCPLEYESYWINVVNSRAQKMARMHLWAAYGTFDIVAVDLVDGPGDELVIVRIPAHATPPIGYDLKIWKLGPTAPVELIEPMKVADLFGTQLIGCARWRTHLFINRKEAKPRPVTLRNEFAATVAAYGPASVCRLSPQDTDRVRMMRRDQVLQIEKGKYRLR